MIALPAALQFRPLAVIMLSFGLRTPRDSRYRMPKLAATATEYPCIQSRLENFALRRSTLWSQ